MRDDTAKGNGQGLDVMEFLGPLMTHRWRIALVLAATVVSTYLVLQLITEQYETRASVLVKIGRENADVPSTVAKGGIFTTGVRKEEINSEIQMLSSPSLIAAVVDEIGPEAFRYAPPPPEGFLPAVRYYIKKTIRWGKAQGRAVLVAANLQKDLTDREQAIAGIRNGLVVEREKDSDVISLRLQSPDGQLSVRILTKLLSLYHDEHIRVRREVEVRPLFEEQVKHRRQRLDTIEDARQQVRTRYNLSSVPDQRLLLLRQRQDLRTQMATLENEQAVMRAQQREMRERLGKLADETPTARVVTPNPSLQTIKERVTTLQSRRAELATRYSADSQVLRNIEQEIAALEQVLKSEDATLVASLTSEANPLKQNFLQTIEQVDVKLAGIEASLRQLEKSAEGIDSQLRRLDAGERELLALDRERKIAEEDYLAYSRRGEEAFIDEELDRKRVANIAVLQPPATSIEPVYPRRLFVLGLSLPLGLLLGVGMALLGEYFNDRVSTPDDVESIGGLPYLETIHIAADDAQNGERSRVQTFLHAKLGRFR